MYTFNNNNSNSTDQFQYGNNSLQSNAITNRGQQNLDFDTSNYLNNSNGYNPLSSGLSSGGGINTNNLQLGLSAVQTIGSLWNSFQQNKLAKQSLGLQTQAYKTNLKNQTSSYNTALEDRIRSRYATEGRSPQADSYINKHKL